MLRCLEVDQRVETNDAARCDGDLGQKADPELALDVTPLLWPSGRDACSL
jgi:hypothetical protein